MPSQVKNPGPVPRICVPTPGFSLSQCHALDVCLTTLPRPQKAGSNCRDGSRHFVSFYMCAQATGNTADGREPSAEGSCQVPLTYFLPYLPLKPQDRSA